MRAVWDEAKNRSNRKKHGISFDTAALVFFDPLHLSRKDRSSKVKNDGRRSAWRMDYFW
jgi:uncharacterized DUF497 family protein